jgi:Protein kinase domain
MGSSQDTARLGDYVIVRELRPLAWPRFVARTPTGERFVIERVSETSAAASARNLVRLQHPNLVRISAVREIEDADGAGLWILSEYVEGTMLADLAAAGPIPPAVYLRIATDVLNGLSALHGHRDASGEALGLFHGDVSPNNIVLSLDGSAHLAHFLRPRVRRGAAKDERPSVAPELRAARTDVDSRADLYSVAVLLADALRQAPAEPWFAALTAVLDRTTKADPNQRIATAAEMSAEIRRAARAHIATPAKVAAAVREGQGAAIAQRRERLSKAPGPTTSSAPSPLGMPPRDAPKGQRELPQVPVPKESPESESSIMESVAMVQALRAESTRLPKHEPAVAGGPTADAASELENEVTVRIRSETYAERVIEAASAAKSKPAAGAPPPVPKKPTKGVASKAVSSTEAVAPPTSHAQPAALPSIIVDPPPVARPLEAAAPPQPAAGVGPRARQPTLPDSRVRGRNRRRVGALILAMLLLGAVAIFLVAAAARGDDVPAEHEGTPSTPN